MSKQTLQITDYTAHIEPVTQALTRLQITVQQFESQPQIIQVRRA